MMIRRTLILAIVLTVLIASVTLPAVADNDKTNKGQDKKAEATETANSNAKKDGTSSATATPLPDLLNLTTATPTISPAPALYITGQKDKLKVSNIHKPNKTDKDTTVTTVTPGAATSVPANDARAQADKSQADKKIQVTLKQIDAYIKWVKNSRLSESEKAALISEANETRDWYLQMSEDIAAASDGNDLQASLDQVDQYNGVLKADLKKNSGLIASDDVSAKLDTARNVSVLAAQKIAAEKANGTDTAGMEQLLSSYDAHVGAAEVHTSAAKVYFSSITGPEDSGKLFSDGYGELQRAETELNMAYDNLKSIYRLLFSVN